MSLSTTNKAVYSDLKVFGFPQFIDNLTTGHNSPIHIRIKPTNRCNHSCRYCSYRNPKQSLGKDMVLTDEIPFLKMMEAVDDMAEMGVRAVTFSGGGEPTVYRYLDVVLKELVSNKIKIAMLTNGALFSGDIANVFSEYGSWVRISVDGWDRESYKEYRGVDDFDRVINNIKDFKSDKCLLGINLVVTKENSNHLYELINLINGDNINSIKISPCVVDNDVRNNILYHQQIKSVVDKQLDLIERDFNIPIKYTYHEQLCGFDKDYTWCPNIQIRPVIGADQNIYTCHDKAYELPNGIIGSFKHKRFKDAWREADKFRINPARDCKHHCMAHNKNIMVLDYLNIYKDHQEFL